VEVIDIGMTMVGAFYWAQYYLQCPGGVFVTASHNPAQYNGFKFANGYSETLVSEGMQELRRMVEAEDYESADLPGKLEEKDILTAYIADLKKRFPAIKKLKVVVDAGCATAGVIVPPIFLAIGLEVVEYNTKIDSSFPLGAPDPTETRVAERVGAEVLVAGADLGFSFDADGDRIGIVDEKGGIIWNDVLLALFAASVLQDHPGATIMYNALCSKTVEDTIIANGGKPFMWRVGHSFLKSKNREVKAAFIGELAGHFFFSADFYNHDDGAYSALRLLDYLSRTDKKLSEAVASLPRYVSSPEIKLYAADDKKVELMKKISPILKQDFPEAEVIDDERVGDGVRLNLADGMFVIRYSQNGPYITIKFEGKKQERYDELKKYINQLLHSFDEIEWGNKINVNNESLE
jgi:phosphomannomutase